MNETKILTFSPFAGVEFELRTTADGGKDHIAASDVCRVLGIKNTSQALKHLDASEKGLCPIYTRGGPKVRWAKAFKKWLTSVVIPSIRKNGGYIVGQETKTREQILADAVLLGQAVIAEMSPKAATASTTATGRLEGMELSALVCGPPTAKPRI